MRGVDCANDEISWKLTHLWTAGIYQVETRKLRQVTQVEFGESDS